MSPLRSCSGAVVTAAALTMLVSSCNSAVEIPTARPNTTTDTMPEFTGPWAAEFIETWRDPATAIERDALEDGVISEIEYAEVIDRMTRCMSDAATDWSEELEHPAALTDPESASPDDWECNDDPLDLFDD